MSQEDETGEPLSQPPPQQGTAQGTQSAPVVDPSQALWEDAWIWREEELRRKRELQISTLKESRSKLHADAMVIEAALSELEGRGDWTQLMKPLHELQWLHFEPPARRALLMQRGECVLPLGKVGFFVGEGGIGKSWALTQLAIAVATGTPWLKTFDVPPDSAGGVVMAMGEEDQDELHRRIHSIVSYLPLAAHDLSTLEQRLWPLPLAGHFMEFLDDGERSFEHERFERLLKEHTPEEGWKLIILDPASRFMGIDAEKDNALATRFVQLLERLTALPGQPTVLCAHHTTKVARTSNAGAKSVAARGASALTDGARWQGNLFVPMEQEGATEQEGLSVFQVTKSNYGPKPPPLFLQRTDSGVLVPLTTQQQLPAGRSVEYEPNSHFSETDTDDMDGVAANPARKQDTHTGARVSVSEMSRGKHSDGKKGGAKRPSGSVDFWDAF